MPVCHFTIHAYGSYLPDHDAGSYHWQRGFQEPNNDELADVYRRRQGGEAVTFTDDVQGHFVNELRIAAEHQRLRLCGLACESTHVHVVAAWDEEDHAATAVRTGLKSSLTRRLNRDVERRTWLSKRGVPRRVWDRGHLSYLISTYLPKHSGKQWYERSI